MVPSINGAGVHVAQPEAGAPTWQVNPAVVGQPTSLFTWICAQGSSNAFPNNLGSESWHANEVGKLFFGSTSGVATNPAHVDSYDADYFYGSLIAPEIGIPARVANQSFIFAAEFPVIDGDYDDYVARYGTVFVCGAGNAGAVSSPATAYNVIAVGAYGGSSSVGPTIDGRCKPDITAPASLTSYSTPLVAGAATLLIQAAERNDAGPNTASQAADARTVKALLLNSASKPAGWTNLSVQPLDLRYGAGILNVGNAYRQLRGGRHSPNATVTIGVGEAHPPANTSSNLPARRGWALASISSTVVRSTVDHYFIDLTGVAGRDLNATLVWNRGEDQTAINNLDLFVFDAATGAQVASSESLGNNVEHIHISGLPAGRYNLQVLKHGGAGRITPSETYALAFEFGPVAAPRLEQQQTDGAQFQARVSGEPNQWYAVEISADLANWSGIATNKTSAQGWFEFTNSGATPCRFYRAAERW